MAARRPFWKWHRWKSIGFCLWPPSTCIWSLKLKFQSKLDLCSGNHAVYRQTDGRTDGRTDRRTDGRTRWIQYTPPPTSLGGGIIRKMETQQNRKFWQNTTLCNFNVTSHIFIKISSDVQSPWKLEGNERKDFMKYWNKEGNFKRCVFLDLFEYLPNLPWHQYRDWSGH